MSAKQNMFCIEYLVDLNGTQAAIRAGYSKKTAKAQACELLKKPEIMERINELKAERERKTKVTAEKIVKELARIAFFDIRKLYDENGNLKEVKDLDEDTARAIGGIDVGLEKTSENVSDYVKKIKTIDKKGALELLGKHLAMFTENINHTGELTFSQYILMRKQKEQQEASITESMN